jgi:Zn-dependent protease
MMGRLTLNPIAHIDPIGTIIVPVMLFILSNGAFIFGTAKPVPVNFYNLKHPRRDSALVSAAGPVTNVVLAFISILLYALILEISPSPMSSTSAAQRIALPLLLMFDYSVKFNLFIAAFNLFPVPPLDGGRIATSLLPRKYAYHFSKLEPYGILIVLGLWFTGIAQYIIAPIQAVIKIILGVFLIPFGGFM